MANGRVKLFWEILLAIILPPLGVCLKFGCCSCEFWVSLLLTLLGYIPGIIYAIYAIVVKHEDYCHIIITEPAAGAYVPINPGPVHVPEVVVPVSRPQAQTQAHHAHGPQAN